MHGEGHRPAWAEIDLEALQANVRAFRAAAAPATLCAVVKADAYGHGAVAVSRAAVAAGATCLAVATVAEGAELRAAGIDASIMVLSEPRPEDAAEVVALGLVPVVYTETGIDALARAAGPDIGRAHV